MPSILPRYAVRNLSFVDPDDEQDTEPYVWVGLFDVPITVESTWPGAPVGTARMALSRIGVPRLRVTRG